MSGFPQNPDVIVIGAGTAGLSAAQTLKSTGFETLVLEADDHVGGRCITDSSTFSAPFDRGGSWLHSAEINPLSPLAEEHGLKLHKTPWDWQKVVIEGKHLTPEQMTDYTAYVRNMWDHIVKVGSKDQKTAIEPILQESEWKDTAKRYVAQMYGGDSDVTSPVDYANYENSKGDWLVEGGLGSFIKHLHSDVPVALNCLVSKIDTSGKKICVTTSQGIIEADHVVITVSGGVLAAEKIEFVPPLPNHKLQAISDLPNGLLNKVGIEFDPAWKEVHEFFVLDYHKGGEEFCCTAFRFYDSDLATCFTAGRFAAQLENEGPGAATEFCHEALREAFGNDVLKYVKKTSETAWNTNPNTFGAYSYALPGRTSARETLAETIDERLFFAGEATMPNHYATVHGAYLSGKKVASEIMNIRENGK